MEERKLDLDNEKEIVLKRKKNGVTEVIDPEVDPEYTVEVGETDEEDEEIVFEMPDADEEDNEELASLSKEEAKEYYLEQLRKAKEAEEEGKAYLQDAKTCEEAGNLHEAYLSYKEAYDRLGAEPEIVVGILRCGSENFTAMEGTKALMPFVKNLQESDDETKASFKRDYADAIEAALSSINEERDPLTEKVETLRKERGEKFGLAYKKATRNLIISGSISAVCGILAVVFFSLIFNRADQLYLILGIASAGVFLLSLVFTVIFTKFFVNARNRVKMNADNRYSNDGRRLNLLNERHAFYTAVSTIE